MRQTTLGRTGLRVSALGLGGGGPSRLGTRTGVKTNDSIALVRRAIDLGVTFFDTAETYGTEEIIGRAVRESGERDDLVIATKKSAYDRENRPISAGEMIEGLDASLRRLRVDTIDLYQVHGVTVEEYDHVIGEIVPALLRARDAGKFRHLGVSEAFIPEPTHAMLRERAFADDCWEVVMVGFNLLNQTARETIFPTTIGRGIGTLIMFAVRKALSQPARLAETLEELAERGEFDRARYGDRPLDFLLEDGVAESITDAAYRFCRDEPGVEVTLTGTGSVAHLEANVASMNRPPLPETARERLRTMFAGVSSLTGH
ncbi:MAG: aldo/keto reductase [Phycisphaerales bacterium]